MPTVSVVVPHWPTEANRELLGRCVSSFARAGAHEMLVMCGGPLPTGGSSIAKNINRGLRVVTGEYTLVVNDDVEWLSGDLSDLCQPMSVCSPGEQAFWGPAFCLPMSAIHTGMRPPLVGLLDDRFDGYFEDEDYAIRLRMAGYQFVAVPSCTVEHHHGGSNTIRQLDAPVLMERNRARFLAKWGADAERIWMQSDEAFAAWRARRSTGAT